MESQYQAPGNKNEEALVRIWEDFLGIEPIGVLDNFFELGTDSLVFITIATKIHKTLEVNIPIAVFFNKPTIKELAEFISKAEEDSYSSIEPVEEREYYALSSAQKRLFIISQMDLESIAYNIPQFIFIDRILSAEKLEETLVKLIDRHESLKTSFHMIENQPVQKVHDHVEFSIRFKIEHLEYSTLQSFIRPFDLSHAPLLRIGLMETSEGKHFLIVDMHHIISDGISHRVFEQDFIALYAGEFLPLLRIQYKDYSQWQADQKKSGVLNEQEAFWLRQFEDEIPILDLPTDYLRPSVQSFEGGSFNFQLADEDVRSLKAAAMETDSTLFMVLLSLTTVLLSKLSGQEDIIIGTPVAGRRYADLEKLIGMFVNTLPMRNFPGGQKNTREFLYQVKEQCLSAFENQEYQFEDLVEQVEVIRDAGRNPLFDVMFVLNNINTGSARADITGEFEKKEFDSELTVGNDLERVSKFDLTISAVESGDNLFIGFQYCTRLFKEETIQRFAGYFKRLVSSIMESSWIKLVDIQIISPEEKERLLFDFNNSEIDYPKDKSIQQLFEEQVVRTPDRIAVAAGGSITYRESNLRSNGLARLLNQKGVGPGTIVALMADRTIDTISGILGILKAGGAYLPIIPDYPMERKSFMLKDSSVDILVLGKELEHTNHSMVKPGLEKIFIDSSAQTHRSISKPPRAPVKPAADELAYVIYTSGTTGRPKGVLVEHRSAVNTVTWFGRAYHLKPGTHVLLMSDYIFDPSVNQIFGSLLNGSKLHITEKSLITNAVLLRQYIEKHQINIINFVPVFFKELLSRGPKLSSIQVVLSGGERLDDSIKEDIINKGYVLYNQYGPTETTIDALVEKCSQEKVTLGTPISNTRCYILSKYHYLVPIGIAGELYIGGSGVARGYLNNPDLTDQRFIRLNPQTLNYKSNSLPKSRIKKQKALGGITVGQRFLPDARLYKTGDLTRWLANGTIEFMGRLDSQVKIRGYRIEPGEIENWLLKYPGVLEAVLVAAEDKSGDKYICAYVVSDKELVVSNLRDYLLKNVPDYMVPSYFMKIDRVPLMPNGKVDRKALPAPQLKAAADYIPPGSAIEIKLVQLWFEVLGVEDSIIGIDSNFFELGGHSLKATILVSRIHKVLNVKIPLTEVFRSPTIRGLARYIHAAAQERYVAIEPVEKREYYGLSSAQKRMYILHRVDSERTLYNMSSVVKLEGNLNEIKFEQAIQKLVNRHESLRTSFDSVNGKLVQKIQYSVEFKVEYHWSRDSLQESPDSNIEVESIIEKIIRPFDLADAPLMRVGIIKFPGQINKHILVVDMHHIISDGTSMTLITRDFMSLYADQELPKLRIHYKDFSEWQHNLIISGEMRKQEEYWSDQFKNGIPKLGMLTDFPRISGQTQQGKSISFELDIELTKNLNDLALETKTSLFILLMAAFTILLSKSTNQEDIVVGTGIFGRKHTDQENIVGMFVNMLALRNHPAGHKTFVEYLEEVKKNTLNAFENQDYQFDELVAKLNIPREYGRNPIFDTQFTLQNAEQATIKIPGLELKPYNYAKNDTMKFDLSLQGFLNSETIGMSLEYKSALFKPSTIETMTDYYLELVRQVTENKSIKIKDIAILLDLESGVPKVTKEDSMNFKF